MNIIELRRWYLPMVTLSRFNFKGIEMFAVERPWNNNRRYLAQDPDGTSCVPEGVYELGWRRSGVVERSTGGEFKHGWEVTDVADRTFIMIHPGNTVRDVVGCIAPGLRLGAVNGAFGVLDSRDAYRRFVAAVQPGTQWFIDIRTEAAPWAR